MEALEQSYRDAHDEAKKSIEAQLGLFNELDGSAKTSIDNLIETLKGQVDYMDTYAENIKRAMELGVDEGLIQKLSDGSEESAQILAAIVAGGEEDIAALNEQLARVEEGKENFSSTVAEMETDFSSKMADLEQRALEAVENLNVSVEAGEAGAATIQGYIDGAESMRGQLVAKYESLAKAANAAFASGTSSVAQAAAKSTPATTTTPAPKTSSGSGGGKSGGNTTVNVTINSPKALNEKETARQVKNAQRDLSLSQ